MKNRILSSIFLLSLAACGGEAVIGQRPGQLTQAGLTSGGSCGDNTNNIGEECDDGNSNSGDGCSDACVIEDGWVCNSQGTVCEDCGDGFAVIGVEGCDDGNETAGDGCSAVCTLEPGWSCPTEGEPCLGCGDGIQQSGEVCDDGVYNGDPGFCAADCLSVLDWELTASPSDLSDAPPGSVGVFLSTWLPVEVDELDVADWLTKSAYFDGVQVVGGRVITLAADTIVKNPVLIFDDGVDPFDGGGVASAGPGRFEMAPGTFEIPAGATVMSPVVGGTFIGDDCRCGTLGSASGARCAGDGPGLPPEPNCDGPTSQCPDFNLAMSKDVSGGLSPLPGSRISCDQQCLIAGAPRLCGPDNPGPPRTPPGILDPVCNAAGGADVPRLCQMVGGVRGVRAEQLRWLLRGRARWSLRGARRQRGHRVSR